MNLDVILIVAIATFLNFAMYYIKAYQGRKADLFLDIGLMLIINSFFAGTLGGMAIAMIVSFLAGIALWIFPPKLPNFSQYF